MRTKSNKLASAFERNSKSNITRTENGAETYASTLNSVLDFFYLAPARQDQDNTELFRNAFYEDRNLALKALFYIRDVRGGKGQRNTFTQALDYLFAYDRRAFEQLIPYVAEYGRWKDIIKYVGNKTVVNVVLNQISNDYLSSNPSLLAKWMPSENATSPETIKLAKQWIKALNFSPRDYRKMLSNLRARIDIPERKMSEGEWEAIEYTRVPSRAMKLYRKAFEKHDEDRFKAFVGDAMTGKVKINSSTVYPHEIVQKFLQGSGDNTLEAMWNQLPNYFGDEERNVLPLIDVSSSMTSHGVMHIGIALGMYCAERNNGPFQNMFLTFSDTPQIVTIKGSTLRARVQMVKNADWGGSTNLQACFRLLLETAKKNRVPAKDMPTDIIVLSDMEFNEPHIGGKNFDAVKSQYQYYGYEMPRLTFWNLNARHNQAPVTKNQDGAFLVSGFSAETIGKVLNAESSTPMQLMLEVLESERYSFVDRIMIK